MIILMLLNELKKQHPCFYAAAECASRFINVLLLNDRNAKALESSLISGRAQLNTCNGDGNTNFFKYSSFGQDFGRSQKYFMANYGDLNAVAFQNLLSWPSHYASVISCPKEISSIALTSTARTRFNKFKKDCRIGGAMLH